MYKLRVTPSGYIDYRSVTRFMLNSLGLRVVPHSIIDTILTSPGPIIQITEDNRMFYIAFPVLSVFLFIPLW